MLKFRYSTLTSQLLKISLLGMSSVVLVARADQMSVSSVTADVNQVEQAFTEAVAEQSTIVNEIPAGTEPLTVETSKPIKPSAEEIKQAVAVNTMTTPTAENTTSMVAPKQTVSEALKAKEGEGSAEKNIEEVFNRSKTYSLIKKNTVLASWDSDYSFYRDSRIDIATQSNSSDLLRFRVEDDAQHTLTNVVSVQYGLKDNLTLGVSVPLIAKMDVNANKNVAGLGDIGFSARWEPFELERNKLPLTLSGNFSTKTGESPFEVPANTTLSTGKGYYSFGGGISTRKFYDPVVLFASAQLGYGLKANGLDQSRGQGVLRALQPGMNFGIALGYAYSLNYDVSLSMSYSQGFSYGTVYYWKTLTNKDGTITTNAKIRTGLESSATLSTSLGIRISPETIVNTTLGIGLTEDAPDVSLGVSLPLNLKGFKKSKAN